MEEENNQTENQELKKPSFSIGGVSSRVYDDDVDNEEPVVNSSGVVRQTMVIGLDDKNESNQDKQIEIIGPELQEEHKVAQQYTSASQQSMSQIKSQSKRRMSIIIMVSVLVIAALSGLAYVVLL